MTRDTLRSLGLAALLGVAAGCHDMQHDPPPEPDAAVRPDARVVRACPEALLSCASTLDGVDRTQPSTREPFELAWSARFRSAAGLAVLGAHQQLAVRSDERAIHLLDVRTGATQLSIDAGEPLALSISADADDNIYVAGRTLHAFSATGFERWSVALDTEAGLAAAPTIGDGLVYVLTPTTLRALSTTHGGQRWSRAIDSDVGRSAGRGDTLVVPTAGDGYLALDAATGAERWRSRQCPHRRYSADPIATRTGFVMMESDKLGSTDPPTIRFTMDSCGGKLATLPRTQSSLVLEAPDGQLLTSPSSGDGLDVGSFGLFDVATGKPTRGLAVGSGDYRTRIDSRELLAIGADGYAYFLHDEQPSPSTSGEPRLFVRRFSLRTGQLVGTVELADAFFSHATGVTMDGSGVLYIARQTSVVAVRTPSPGPAAGRWSLPDGNMRGSRWLN